MLHAVYFNKSNAGDWCLSYRNKYVDTESFKLESKMNQVTFIPAADGQPYAMLVGFVFNMVSITDAGGIYKVEIKLKITEILMFCCIYQEAQKNYIEWILEDG